MSETLGNSSQEQALLRPVALWAADFAEEALLIFEKYHPDDTRPREAIKAGRDFGRGKKRDKNLRMAAFAAMKAGKGVDESSKHAVQAAVLTAAVAYAHTDLQTGIQGVRQARHILGPVVQAALAQEVEFGTGTDTLMRAVTSAPPEVRLVLQHMPPQPSKKNLVDIFFKQLDSTLREKQK